MEFPERKTMRLKGYDYSLNGAYFVTICIKERKPILWQRSVGANFVRPCNEFSLSAIGQKVEKEIEKLTSIYDNVKVDKYCIMPNHIHMILFVLRNENGRTQFAPTMSRVIKQFKGSITKQIGISIWQRSYYDRIIRNDTEYQDIWKYIEVNPLLWEQDELYRL